MRKIFTFFAVLLLVFELGHAQNQWTFVSTFPAPNPQANSLSAVDANTLWVCCAAGGGAARVYLSVKGGLTWSLRATGLPAVDLYGISAIDTMTCWVGTVAGSLYKTTNGGSSWTLQFAVAGSFTNGVQFFNSNYGVYYGDPIGSGSPYQFRQTTNGGTTWTLVPGAPTAGSEFGVINAWDWTDTNHFWIGSANTVASSTNAKIYRTSTGYFGTWSNVVVTGVGGTTGCYYQAVAFINATSGIIGSSGGDLKKTTDGGATYTACTVPPGLGTSYAIMQANGMKDGSNTVRVAIDSGGVSKLYKTTNLGTSWVNEALPLQASTNNLSHIRFINANLGYAVLGSTTVTLGGLIKYSPISGVTPITGKVPSSYKLEQNYPNPFNPTTNISFMIPQSGFVTMKIYDAIGREVETLLSESMTAGTYTVTYDASKLKSGIYFYNITSGNFTDTKKMVLVK